MMCTSIFFRRLTQNFICITKHQTCNKLPTCLHNSAEIPPEAPKVTASIPTKTPAAPAVASAVSASAPNPTPAIATTSSMETAPGYGTTDTSLDEGPAFDGKTGFGLAKGTTNTYAIPGMDEMTPEEYRNKLQESISARQAKRREESLKSRGGMIGNANSQSYLDGLSKGETPTVTSAMDLSSSSSSSSSVEKSHAVNHEVEVKSDRGITKEVGKDHTKENDPVPLDVEDNSNKEEKQNQSALKAVVTSMEKSKSQMDLIRMSEWQTSSSAVASHVKEDDVKIAAENKSQTSRGFFIKNDNTRQNPILGRDPSKNYPQVHDRTGSTSQRPLSTGPSNQSVFDKNSVGAIRKSPLKPKEAVQSLANSEMDFRQRPTPGSEMPNYQTVSGRTTVGDFRKSKPSPLASSNISLVESEKRLRPTPGTELPDYHKVSDRRSVGDMRKSVNKSSPSNLPMSSLVGSEKRQRPTPGTNSSTQTDADFKTFVGDLRNSSNKPLPLSSPRTSLAQTENRTRPAPSSELPSHSQVRDIRSVGDFRDPATKKPRVVPTSLIESEARQRPAVSTSSKDTDVSDSRGVVFKTSSAVSSANNTPASLIADEVRQRPSVSTNSRDVVNNVSDSRGVVFKTSSAASSANNTPASLIADEVRQRPNVSTSSRDVVHNVSDSRGVVFKSSLSKLSTQTTASLISDEVRQRPIVSSSLRKFAQVEDRTGDARRVAAKKSSTQPSAPRPLFDNKRTRPPRASTDPRKYARVQDRTGPDVRRAAKVNTATSAEEESHWWNEKTQRPRTIPSKKAEALERDTQTQSSSVRKSHMKEEKRRREQDTFQAPIAELQPSSLKALVKEERHEEEENHTTTTLKFLLKDDRPIAGVNEAPPKPDAKKSQLNSLLKDEKAAERSKTRKKHPANAGDEWWNEKPVRPEGYVKHSQPMNTSYEKKEGHLRDYGDVVIQHPASDSIDNDDVHDEDIH